MDISASVRPHAVRFGARSGEANASATWKLWTPGKAKSDLYVACRQLHGEIKVSLHESGHWHIAYSKEFYETGFSDPAPPTRFIDRWQAAHIAPGMSLALRVLIPWFSVTLTSDDEDDPEICWLAAPDHGEAIDVVLIITGAHVPVSGWPGKDAMNTALLDSFTLSNGSTAWLVYQYGPFNFPAMAGSPGYYRNFSEAAINDSALQLRAVVVGSMPDGSRVLCEGPVNVSNGGS